MALLIIFISILLCSSNCEKQFVFNNFSCLVCSLRMRRPSSNSNIPALHYEEK